MRFARPYYAFRPRLSLGFGLWVGSPFAYAHSYYDPFYQRYGYATRYGYPPYGYPPYGYPAASYPGNPPPSSYPPPSNYPTTSPPSAYPPNQQGPRDSLDVQPGQEKRGGVSFDISPATAELIVDGTPVGTVGEFTPSTEPLGLLEGRHQIEVRAPGYRTMSFAVDIIAGQVIPYQGVMQR